MSLLDKAASLAKTATDKAGETFEVTKLNVKINGQKEKIMDCQRRLGEYYFNQFASGELLDEEATIICNQIISHKDEISGLEAQIQEIKET